MRRRVLWVAMIAVVLAIVVLGVPLAFAVSTIVSDNERGALEQQALRAAVEVTPTYLAGDPIELPDPSPGVSVGVYDVNGHRISGTGPELLEVAAAPALTGTAVSTDVDDQLLTVIAVSTGEQVIGVVRASVADSVVQARSTRWWLALTGGALVAALCAALFAELASRRLVRPLTALTRTAVDLGSGDFSVRTRPSGVSEIDLAGEALQRTAERLASLVEAERAFTARASHQLRTPLTHLRLELESGLAGDSAQLRAAATSAIVTVDQLSSTIDDVLALTRPDAPAEEFDLEPLIMQATDNWRGLLAESSRPLRVQSTGHSIVTGSESAVRQMLHVLLDNAFKHGNGTVTVTVRPTHGAIAIDVADEGTAPPISPAEGNGMGLSMVSALAVAEGGRLIIDQQGPSTRFTVLLPAAQRLSFE